MIPRTIHYCWFGDREPGGLMRKCLQSWREAMPDYRIKRWDHTNSPFEQEYAKEASRRKLWARLANYVRLYALYTEGGLYFDTDVEALRDLSPLLADPCFAGFQEIEEQSDWIGTAILGAQAGHAFIGTCLEGLLDSFNQTGRFERSPTVVTRVLRDWGLERYGLQHVRDVTIYPIEYFYPYSWLEQFSTDRITANTYCIHHWVGSWKSRLAWELPRPLRKLKRSGLGWIQRRWKSPNR